MNIFEQDDYKTIIKYWIRSKIENRRGAFKNLAGYLGVHATLVSQILSGTKDFSEEQLFATCEFLGIPKLESRYLWILLQIERAGSVTVKKHYVELKEQLQQQAMQITHRIEKDRVLTETEKAVFYSSWIYSAIHVATTLEKKIDFEFICTRFQIHPAKAREIINFLIEIQMIKEKEGRFYPGTTSTHLETSSPFIGKHHTNWRLKAIEASENLRDDELMYSANFSISNKDFKLLREELVQVIQRFLKIVKDSPGEDIAEFNLDFFRI
ncbi:MAG: TIGR02147 family protein [Bdellovibrio sp.]